jgi:hypothetical protein
MFEEMRAKRRARIAAAELTAARTEAAASSWRSHRVYQDHTLAALESTQASFDRRQSFLFDLQNYNTSDGIDEANDHDLVRNAYKLWATDSFAHGWIELFTHFIVGAECQLKAKGGEAAQTILDDFCAGESSEYRHQSPWVRVAQEFVRRTLRDGRCFLVKAAGRDGKLYTRFLNPIWVRNTGEYGAAGEFGIITDPNDVQLIKFITYWPGVNWKPTIGDKQRFPGKDVIYAKINDDDCKSGRPILLPLMPDLIAYNLLLFSRLKLNYLRSLIYREETYEGLTDEEIEAIHNRKKAEDRNASGNYEKIPVSGSLERHGSKMVVEYKTPNLQNSDADVEFRRVGLRFVVGLGLTESMATGDAKQQNYHGGEIAESVACRTIKSWQWGFFSPFFRRLGQDVLQAAARAGKLSQAEADEGVQVDFPLVIERDIKAATEAIILQSTTEVAGRPLMSRRTAQLQLDLDPEYEDDVIDEEQEEHPPQPDAEDQLAALMGNGNGNGAKTNGQRQTRPQIRPQAQNARAGTSQDD